MDTWRPFTLWKGSILRILTVAFEKKFQIQGDGVLTQHDLRPKAPNSKDVDAKDTKRTVFSANLGASGYGFRRKLYMVCGHFHSSHPLE